jgi:hypothetical protein
MSSWNLKLENLKYEPGLHGYPRGKMIRVLGYIPSS